MLTPDRVGPGLILVDAWSSFPCSALGLEQSFQGMGAPWGGMKEAGTDILPCLAPLPCIPSLLRSKVGVGSSQKGFSIFGEGHWYCFRFHCHQMIGREGKWEVKCLVTRCPGALGKGNCEVQGGVLDICQDGIWVWDDDLGKRPMPWLANVNVHMCVGSGEGDGMAFLLLQLKPLDTLTGSEGALLGSCVV